MSTIEIRSRWDASVSVILYTATGAADKSSWDQNPPTGHWRHE